jgi:ribosomal protein L32
MNKVNWTQVGVFAVVVLLVFLIGVSLLGGLTGYGMMGGGRYGMMGPGMMGGWGFGPFAWLFMLMGLLFPVGLLVLLVLGIVWLFRRVGEPSGPTSQAPAGPTCSNCGRLVQAGWRLCPYCGQALTSVGEGERA